MSTRKDNYRKFLLWKLVENHETYFNGIITYLHRLYKDNDYVLKLNISRILHR